jgi:hypothetical protein
MVNWDNYRQDFPLRYILPNDFDIQLEMHVEADWPQTALDVGGGTFGTQALKKVPQVWLLDPFVTKCANWQAGSKDWCSTDKYDLVVARGSINYLSITELMRLKTFLNNGGSLWFNTFLNPPSTDWTSREFESETGFGIEKSRLRGNIVQHELVFPNGKIIRHEFYYRNREFFEKLFPGVIIGKYGKNSFLLKWQCNI